MTALMWLTWAFAHLANPNRRKPRYRGAHRASNRKRATR